MYVPPDPAKASPAEYLRYLQHVAEGNFATLGGWRSAATDAELRDSAVLEGRLEQNVNALAESSGLQGEELEKLKEMLSTEGQDLHSIQMPTDVIGSPIFYNVFAGLVRNVEQAVARLGYEVPEQVTFGALPTGQVNGLACAVPAGGLIVALDDGVFTFFNLVAKAVASFYTIERTLSDGQQAEIKFVEPDIIRALVTNHEGSRRWLEAITATFVYGHPDLAPTWPSPVDRVFIVDQFLTPAEMFIVAHEYAHLILGHYDRDRPMHRRRLAGGVEIDDLETLREDELEADRIGLQILREHQRELGASVENSRWGVHFLHGCLNTLALADTTPTPDHESTHPSPNERAQRLIQQLNEEDAPAEGAIPFDAYVLEVMKQLFFHNLDRYIEWRALALTGTTPWDLTPRVGLAQTDSSP